MEKHVLKLEDVWKVYMMGEVEVPALKGVNLEILKKDYISIIGPSGSGKSTLLNIMGCLDSPTDGEVYIDEIPTSKMTGNDLARIRRKKIGFVFQTFNLVPSLTALENVAMPMRFDGYSAGEAKKRATELLELVGLGDRVKHRPSELSGGQRQRVAIARALVNDPEVLLADEPTGNLDTVSGHKVVELLEDLHDKGITLIVITHDQRLAGRSHIQLHLIDGRIVEISEFEKRGEL